MAELAFYVFYYFVCGILLAMLSVLYFKENLKLLGWTSLVASVASFMTLILNLINC